MRDPQLLGDVPRKLAMRADGRIMGTIVPARETSRGARRFDPARRGGGAEVEVRA
jgi:hypothetical protein